MSDVIINHKMPKDSKFIKDNTLRTLLYYDIFDYPLKEEELYTLLPFNSMPKSDIISLIKKYSKEGDSRFSNSKGYVFVKPKDENIELRLGKEKYSQKMWRIARVVTHLIKRFPFVRCVLITGTLSKNSSDRNSDLDFMVITSKNRLWIARTLLMLFKKLCLLNSHRYFCINYFISEDKLEIEEKNLFTATEIIHIKSTYNSDLMHKFIKSNSWIKEYFPNYKSGESGTHNSGYKVNNRHSYLQKFIESLFPTKASGKLDMIFRDKTVGYFKKKYKEIDKPELSDMFKSTQNVSKTHPQNMQKRILEAYSEKLKLYNLIE